MSTNAPRPPTKRLFAAACVTGGVALGILAIIGVGHGVYGNIPNGRLLAYALAVLVLMCATGTLATQYLVQKHRRDAWWDGFAASDEPLAEVIELHDVKNHEGSKRKFINGTPT